MLNTQIELQNFVENFFNRLKCRVYWEGKRLRVENVPKEFEAFVGKKGPYKFIFSEIDKGVDEELLTKGGFFVSSIANYIKKLGQSSTTVIKLKFDLDLIREINDRFTFLNSKLKKVKQSKRYDYLVRFTFSTAFQYLNEKDSKTETVCIYNGKPLEVKLDRYESSEGNKKEISVGDLKEEYGKAKEIVKSRVSKRTGKISEMLSKKLDKELKRVNDHFDNQVKEYEKELHGFDKQIELLNKKLEKKPEEKEDLISKIHRVEEQKNKFLQGDKLSVIEKERKFFLEDEKHKHGLNISNKLINTSIIYFPEYILSLELEKDSGLKTEVKTKYNEIQKYMEPIKSVCSDEGLFKVYIDDAGLPCKESEVLECIESGKRFAKSEMNLVCQHCKKPVYKDYAVKGSDGKYYAKSYVKTDCLTGREDYIGFLKLCPSSKEYTKKENFKPCKNCGKEICDKGIVRKFVSGSVLQGCNLCINQLVKAKA